MIDEDTRYYIERFFGWAECLGKALMAHLKTLEINVWTAEPAGPYNTYCNLATTTISVQATKFTASLSTDMADLDSALRDTVRGAIQASIRESSTEARNGNLLFAIVRWIREDDVTRAFMPCSCNTSAP